MNTRTNIVIDDKIMKRAMKATGASTKRQTVDIALREVTQHGRRGSLSGSRRSVLTDPEHDVRTLREGHGDALDESIVAEAMKLTGAKTRSEVFGLGLRRLIEDRAQQEILELYGTGGLAPGYDYKKHRAAG